jgi:predicted flap endonuclease-1-like 5' DNA nuclease
MNRPAAGDEPTGQKSLTSIEGVGPKTAEELIQAGYDTVKNYVR